MSGQSTTRMLEPYLKIMVEKQASDLFFVTGAPPNMKVQGKTSAIATKLNSIAKAANGHSGLAWSTVELPCPS